MVNPSEANVKLISEFHMGDLMNDTESIELEDCKKSAEKIKTYIGYGKDTAERYTTTITKIENEVYNRMIEALIGIIKIHYLNTGQKPKNDMGAEELSGIQVENFTKERQLYTIAYLVQAVTKDRSNDKKKKSEARLDCKKYNYSIGKLIEKILKDKKMQNDSIDKSILINTGKNLLQLNYRNCR